MDEEKELNIEMDVLDEDEDDDDSDYMRCKGEVGQQKAPYPTFLLAAWTALVGSFFFFAGNHVKKNEGAFARDNLANERTFLAWLRTSLGVAGLGVAVAKLRLVGASQLAGSFLVLVGLFILAYSTYRYYRVLRLLDRGKFEANRIGVLLIVTLSGLVAVVIAGLVVL